ncbi:hypothetical protein [Streptomyces sp. JNUCC 63]
MGDHAVPCGSQDDGEGDPVGLKDQVLDGVLAAPPPLPPDRAPRAVCAVRGRSA